MFLCSYPLLVHTQPASPWQPCSIYSCMVAVMVFFWTCWQVVQARLLLCLLQHRTGSVTTALCSILACSQHNSWSAVRTSLPSKSGSPVAAKFQLMAVHIVLIVSVLGPPVQGTHAILNVQLETCKSINDCRVHDKSFRQHQWDAVLCMLSEEVFLKSQTCCPRSCEQPCKAASPHMYGAAG